MQDRHIIALDLDGTVLRHGFEGAGDHAAGGIIDPELAEAIRTLHESGQEVIVSTGRSVDATLPIVERLGIRPDWVVTANGAVTLKRDPFGTRGYRREYVEAFNPTDALQKIRPQLTTAHFAVELADGTFLYTKEIPSGTLPSNQRRVAFEDLLGVQAARVIVFSPDYRVEEFMSAIESLGLTHVSYAVGTSSWLDIAPDGVTKASALEVLRAKLGVDAANVFAAGDGRNDIEMLEWAGRRGVSVAMGQAVDEVKAAATEVTATAEAGGLLLALRKRFPELLAS
ncbi:HAD family hydrolase [Leucobacter aridicollis]|uniref:Cof subfamily protein (Haloacid dehalogenase superfamily) n=1 Tax=Leucobacter aridicollis TaxID=283878 RepID=A0A852QV99_9MICO|nr:HAD hydrolase family protein [Leucobacter aridicollis]MBL3683452.1 haloacid dehalogenase [Leucobacter aridicollis]NYD25241.1 Cof subfamily protein (haloacid dehalogenase superfamily) [Leucobacter aridicollis]